MMHLDASSSDVAFACLANYFLSRALVASAPSHSPPKPVTIELLYSSLPLSLQENIDPSEEKRRIVFRVIDEGPGLPAHHHHHPNRHHSILPREAVALFQRALPCFTSSLSHHPHDVARVSLQTTDSDEHYVRQYDVFVTQEWALATHRGPDVLKPPELTGKLSGTRQSLVFTTRPGDPFTVEHADKIVMSFLDSLHLDVDLLGCNVPMTYTCKEIEGSCFSECSSASQSQGRVLRHKEFMMSTTSRQRSFPSSSVHHHPPSSLSLSPRPQDHCKGHHTDTGSIDKTEMKNAVDETGACVPTLHPTDSYRCDRGSGVIVFVGKGNSTAHGCKYVGRATIRLEIFNDDDDGDDDDDDGDDDSSHYHSDRGNYDYSNEYDTTLAKPAKDDTNSVLACTGTTLLIVHKEYSLLFEDTDKNETYEALVRVPWSKYGLRLCARTDSSANMSVMVRLDLIRPLPQVQNLHIPHILVHLHQQDILNKNNINNTATTTTTAAAATSTTSSALPLTTWHRRQLVRDSIESALLDIKRQCPGIFCDRREISIMRALPAVSRAVAAILDRSKRREAVVGHAWNALQASGAMVVSSSPRSLVSRQSLEEAIGQLLERVVTDHTFMDGGCPDVS